MATMNANPVPFTQFRDGLSNYLDRCVRFGERFVVTRHSHDEVVLISSEEWIEISETLSIIGNPELFSQIVESQRDINAGRHRAAKDVFAELDEDE